MKISDSSIIYEADGKIFENSLDGIADNEHFTVRTSLLNGNHKEILNIVIKPKKKLKLSKLQLRFDYEYKEDMRIFANGYQSWTDSIEHKITDRIKGLNHIPKVITKKWAFESYGDYSFFNYSGRRGDIHGCTYGYIRDGEQYLLVGSLNESNGFTYIGFEADNSKIVIQKECDGIIIGDEEANAQYKLFNIIFTSGNESEVFDTYFEAMNIAPPRTRAIKGYTTWYQHYQNISEEIILKNLRAIAGSSLEMEVFQIDDGYADSVGDWLNVDKSKFPNGMKTVCDEIKSCNLIPGIWMAPFACEKKSEVARNHRDWLLEDDRGRLVEAGHNWGGFYAIDFYNEEARSYIRKSLQTVVYEWGYQLLKLDFLYVVCIISRQNKTRGQIMSEVMDFIRECVGDTLILGCGVPLGSAFGKVDYCRIGCDVSLDWDDKWYMRLMHRERMSTKNCIANSIYRRQLNGRAFLNDPDVFFLREDNLKLTPDEKYKLATVNGLMGSVLFTSDDVEDYNEIQLETIKGIYELQKCKILSVDRDKDIVIKYLDTNKQENEMRI